VKVTHEEFQPSCRQFTFSIYDLHLTSEHSCPSSCTLVSPFPSLSLIHSALVYHLMYKYSVQSVPGTTTRIYHPHLSEEVVHEEMQYDGTQCEIGERALWRHVFELRPVCGVDLGSQGCREDELPDTATEACKESVEGEICDEYTVQELYDAREHEEYEEGVDELQAR